MKKKKISPIFVSNIDVGVPEWVPPINSNYEYINTNSWYGINVTKNPEQTEVVKFDAQVPTIPKESYKQQLSTIKRTKSNKTPGFIRAIQNRIYPTIEQEEILQEWFNAFIRMYNITVTFVNYLIYDDKKVDIDIASGLCDFRFLRSILHDDKEKIINSMKNKIRVHLLDEAIKHAVSNFKGCITKFQKGSIKKFRVREMSYNKPKKILIIESSFFGPSDSFHKDLGTMFASIFGKGTVETSYPLEDITKTATLQFNNHTKKYILFVPEILEQDLILKDEIDCGGDGGGRTFYTFYSKNGTYEFGPDMNRILKPVHTQIKTIESKINSKTKPISKAKKRKLKKALAKRREYLKNKVKDMHYKVSHFLVNNFDNIYIGKLSTSQILRRSNNLPKAAKQVIKSLKHYQFRTILTHMGHRYGSKIYLVTEYLTTQTCSNCGALNDIGDNKIYHCKYCGMKTGRDENSAKNHLKIGYEDGTYIYKDKEYRKVELLTEIGEM